MILELFIAMPGLEIDKTQYLPKYKFKRLKTWISIYTKLEKMVCLLYLNHTKSKIYLGTREKDGRIKPILSNDNLLDTKKLLPIMPNSAVLFDDDLVHGGAINSDKFTRVSLEFTSFVSTIN